MLTRLIIFCFGCALLVSSPALGQDSKLRDEAKKLTTEGRAHQDNQRWDEAAEKYRAAYDLVPHPTLLFNLAQVRRLGGKKAEALQFYRKFAATSDDDELVKDANSYIDELESELGEIPFKDPLATKTDSNDGGSKEDGEEDKPSNTDSDSEQGDDKADVVGAKSGPRGNKTMRIAGLATAGLGVALVGGGVYFGLRARSLSDELSETRMDAWTDAELKKDRDGRAANRNMIALSIAGAAALATGTVLYILGRERDEDESGEPSTTAAVQPVEVGNGMSIVFSGRF